MENVPFSSAAQPSYIENRDTRGQTDQLKGGLAEVKKKIDHLLRAIENGVDLDTVLPNVKHLEREKAAIERALLESQREVLDAKSQKVLACSSAEFFLNFEKKFQKAPIQEQKELLRRVVVGIRVSPKERLARCYIAKIPMVTPALKALVNPSGFVGAHCSGDRT